MIIGRLAESDLRPLLAIQHAFAGETAPWTAETLHQILYDRTRAGGDHVRDETPPDETPPRLIFA